MHLKELFYWLY